MLVARARFEIIGVLSQAAVKRVFVVTDQGVAALPFMPRSKRCWRKRFKSLNTQALSAIHSFLMLRLERRLSGQPF